MQRLQWSRKSRGDGYNVTHDGFGFGVRNEEVVAILDFVLAYESMSQIPISK